MKRHKRNFQLIYVRIYSENYDLPNDKFHCKGDFQSRTSEIIEKLYRSEEQNCLHSFMRLILVLAY